ncbi:helix-turn-helix domain-containing transcriptional regulator [Nostoc favosum]|uniref:Uncharacterized protein n=1 Tax=Nostoc favosum CHAB5714 TaxID=2780399 RepID=A0ABS8I325_9NOSO|nr:hypothetical protein [Nostoc favosum]MCC5598291.1 hypothetical protein [Nostoc favosum CHAB5714]
MRKFRTLDEFEEEYFRKHPEEIDDYLTEIFQEYAQDNDSGTLLASLRVVACVREINEIAILDHFTDNFCDSKLDIPQTAEVPTNHDD